MTSAVRLTGVYWSYQQESKKTNKDKKKSERGIRMNYELVQLEEKKVAGLKIRTSNSDPQMSEKIGATWQRFYGDGIEATLTGRKNEKCIGLYSNYENGVAGTYNVMVGCEVVAGVSQPEPVETATIAAGNYAKFIVKGDVQQAVGWRLLDETLGDGT